MGDRYKFTITKDKYIANTLLCMNTKTPREILEPMIKEGMINLQFCTCENGWTCLVCKYACCEKAIGMFCMCTQATRCHKHGFRCNGSHS